MPPESPGQSPFASTDSPGAGRPLAERPEPPRFGILHLIVLTACVAACMAMLRGLATSAEGKSADPAADPFMVAAGTLYGIAGGGALAGLILFLARRLRHIPFPVHPGEYLLVLSAVGMTLQLATWPLFVLASHLGGSDPPMLVSTVFALAAFGVIAVVFIWALVRVKTRRWRVFLLSIPVCHLAAYGLVFLTFRTARPGSSSFVVHNLVPAAPGVVLLVVVLQDHLQGTRYPWSHWMGVALRLWSDGLRIIHLFWILLRWGSLS